MNRFIGSLACIWLFFPSACAQGESLNGTPIKTEAKRQINQPLECRVLDAQFRTVTEVRESFNEIVPYWLSFTNNTGQTPSEVVFRVTFNPASPLIVQEQAFVPGSDTGIRTPFGVPFWALGLTRGPANLVVIAEGVGECSFDFDVVVR